MSHTPGPWAYAGKYCVTASAHFGFTVACTDTFTANSVCPEGERQANAILISAAPDLLESLKWIAKRLERGGVAAASDAITQAEWAIKKAQGE